ncbi:hypothetical protein R6Q59_006761 [Mikania micrantha]
MAALFKNPSFFFLLATFSLLRPSHHRDGLLPPPPPPPPPPLQQPPPPPTLTPSPPNDYQFPPLNTRRFESRKPLGTWVLLHRSIGISAMHMQLLHNNKVRSILLDYVSGRVVREFPPIPGEKRSYPSTGSSVLLPITLHEHDPSPGSRLAPDQVVEVMICGGARAGAFPMAERGVYTAAARTCGRMNLISPQPYWVIETMPLRRVMPDMILLPTGDVLIINGASRGTAGWENAVEPALHPVLYEPKKRLFTVLNPTRRPRMYHSSATLLPDGRILVGGSNPHVAYEFSGVNFPTDLSLESFSPPYMDERFAYYRPSILSVDYDVDESLSYGQYFAITLTMSLSGVDRRLMVTLVAPSFTTHSFAMNQRVLVLYVDGVEQVSLFGYRVTVRAPSSPNLAPPGYYMLFVVHDEIPSHAVWIRLH